MCQFWETSSIATPPNLVSSINLVLSWFFHGLTSFPSPGFLPYYAKLVSYTLFVSESAQADVQVMANEIIKLFPKYILPKHMLTPMIELYLGVCFQGNCSWHIKMKVINAIQVFYFSHIHFLTEQNRETVLTMLMKLIEDSQLEVRNASSEALAGILRCSLRDRIAELKVENVHIGFLPRTT
jgi:hypothetical protein